MRTRKKFFKAIAVQDTLTLLLHDRRRALFWRWWSLTFSLKRKTQHNTALLTPRHFAFPPGTIFLETKGPRRPRSVRRKENKISSGTALDTNLETKWGQNAKEQPWHRAPPSRADKQLCSFGLPRREKSAPRRFINTYIINGRLKFKLLWSILYPASEVLCDLRSWHLLCAGLLFRMTVCV